MNISHAPTIILYEITKHGWQNLSNQPTNRNRPKISSRSETDLLITYLENAAERAGYDIHKMGMLNSAVKRLIVKSNPSSKEVLLTVSLFCKCVLKMQRR